MDNSTLMAERKLFGKNPINIIGQKKAEFLEEILEVNIHREKILAVVLITIDIIMLYTDIFSNDSLQTKSHSLETIFYTHIVLLIIPSIYLLVF
jgi:hypothetical protein